MDWQSINFAMDYLASTGTVFSVEQRVGIQASLTALQKDNKFDYVNFFGKICGTENDYYIAYGVGSDYLKDRSFFYSINRGIDWIMLTLPKNPVNIELGLACRGHFTGNPTADAETDIAPDRRDELNEGEDWVTIKEEERLASTISAIMNEAAVVPRGALIKNPNGDIYHNKTFEGLQKIDALQLHSWYHLRRPVNPWDRNIVVRADYNLSLDFLDSLAKDVPVGCWSLQTDRLETVAFAKTLFWPGFVAYHVLDCSQYGFIYIGTGKKNWDVPFMIAPPPAALKSSIIESGDGDYIRYPGEYAGEGVEYPYSSTRANAYVPQELMYDDEEDV